MNPDIIAAATTGALAALVAVLPAIGRMKATTHRAIKSADTYAATIAAKQERIAHLETQLDHATRYRGWKGVYTNARGERVNVVGLCGYRCRGVEYVIVEPTDVPGRTPYPVKRADLEWNG